jgi:hypothetical protein
MTKKAKLRTKSKSKAKTKSQSKKKSKAALTTAKPKSRAKAETRARVRLGLTALREADIGPIATITQIAARSPIARFNWPGRGVAPIGYIKGLAVVFARVLCKLQAGDPAAKEMAKANTGNAARDVLAHYDEIFRSVGMNNNVSGPDTLRHLFVLMIGLGMRESSGKFCEGQDRSAPENRTANKAEAGLFQTSIDARSASPLLPELFDKFSANPSGFIDIFREGTPRCTDRNLQNFGSGSGRDFQKLSKECPGFAAEFAGVTLRNLRKHYGPINNRAAKVKPECDAMLLDVQNFVNANPSISSVLI